MQETFRIIRLFSEFTNPFKIVSGGILTGIAAFVIALILVVLLRKFILVPRRNNLLKYIAWTYFVILPVLAGFFGFKWGLFSSLRKDIREHTFTYIKHIPPSFDIQTSAAVKTFFKGDVSGYTTNQLIDTTAEIIYRQYDATLEKQALLKEIRNFTRGERVANFMKSSIHKLLKEKLGLDESISKDLMSTSIDEILQAGLFAKIILIQLDHFLQGVQKGILITFFLIITIPLIEIIIAHYLHRKQKIKKTIE